MLEVDSTAPDTDVIFVPHWEQSAIGGQLVDYTTLPYEHRWWWVPDFDRRSRGLGVLVVGSHAVEWLGVGSV